MCVAFERLAAGLELGRQYLGIEQPLLGAHDHRHEQVDVASTAAHGTQRGLRVVAITTIESMYCSTFQRDGCTLPNVQQRLLGPGRHSSSHWR